MKTRKVVSALVGVGLLGAALVGTASPSNAGVRYPMDAGRTWTAPLASAPKAGPQFAPKHLTAPKHLSAPKHLVKPEGAGVWRVSDFGSSKWAAAPKFTSMEAAMRSGLSSFSVDSPRCYGTRNARYSMIASSNWTRATNGSVKLNYISVSFSNGSAISDWATSLTVADRTGSINYSSSSYNPGSVSQWFPSNSPSTATGTRNAYARASSSAAGDCYPGPMYP